MTFCFVMERSLSLSLPLPPPPLPFSSRKTKRLSRVIGIAASLSAVTEHSQSARKYRGIGRERNSKRNVSRLKLSIDRLITYEFHAGTVTRVHYAEEWRPRAEPLFAFCCRDSRFEPEASKIAKQLSIR